MRVGIIGGSGLYQIEGLDHVETISVDTPFGKPSDDLVKGEMFDKEVVFLPRHGKGHRLTPTEVNARANIYALKMMQVEAILSFSAVGSLKPEIKPGDFVIIDQYVDRTNQARRQTFFGDGIVAHIQFAHPLCPQIREVLLQAGEDMGIDVKDGGTYINMEGPAFSTLAESLLYKSWNMDVIGMTQMNEARLAREAEICYATLATVTDYDCWHEAETGETVSVDAIIKVLTQNVERSKKIIRQAVRLLPQESDCSCKRALENSIVTPKEYWPAETKDKLGPIIQKYTNE
jgi:5'-methylthioadenosine phosphorylase